MGVRLTNEVKNEWETIVRMFVLVAFFGARSLVVGSCGTRGQLTVT